ncbi:TetR/AcrR family transcriptional regulator [Paenibacillus chitinolyticus]|uniref:TetR/AcrR family transcriptional regulator n=1 Tax=Paenibacillus chitinolyticus TaxID=79263 RepID=UPI002DBC6457|nr:TetR/AcrR family transcriptional regulator [Paenibacillus chitinolyticus]MEC0244446.1 TetR/AcrR family transcriptional regulator [Paenibacillus chitinolyticus]
MVVREDRKEQIINAAVGIFAELGYYKTTTAMVAKAAGVTQPYVFHFFKNKEELFKVVIDRAVLRLYDAFMQVEGPGNLIMESMGQAFKEFMRVNRAEILMVMQAPAISEPEIRRHMSEKFALIHATILRKFEESGMDDAETAAGNFMAIGLLIVTSDVLQLPGLLPFKDANC